MKNVIIGFTARYELPDWKKAFSNYNLEVLHFEGPLSDVGVNYTDKDPQLFINGPTDGTWNAVGGFWRFGAIKPHWDFEPTLDILAGSSEFFPMVNPAEIHLLCARRSKMLLTLKKIHNIPVVPFQAFISGRYLIESKFKPEFPLVVKIGNYQQGLMKWKIENEDQWHDIFGAMRSLEMPVVIEKFIQFKKDYRTIFIGDEYYTMNRTFEGWKANRSRSLETVETPDEIITALDKIRKEIPFDVGALDYVETDNGFVIFEIGDTPDLDPDYIDIEDPWDKVAKILYSKFHN